MNYLGWNERRRMRARSESASQDYYYREVYYDDLQDVRVKRTREILKEKRSPSQRNNHHVTNPKNNNFSVLVNNSSSHYRYSPKSKIRSHHISHKSAHLIRVSSPLHKARVQMWKSQQQQQQNSGGSSVHSTESTSNGDVESQPQDDPDLEDEEFDDEDPPILYAPGNQIVDDDLMTDPEDNYESSLSLSSTERSIGLQQISNTKTPTAINTDCVQGGRVPTAPLAASLFPFVPPFITFASFEEKGPDLPAAIHKVLKWKLTTITPLLVRKVLLNTGFRLMKSE